MQSKERMHKVRGQTNLKAFAHNAMQSASNLQTTVVAESTSFTTELFAAARNVAVCISDEVALSAAARNVAV